MWLSKLKILTIQSFIENVWQCVIEEERMDAGGELEVSASAVNVFSTMRIFRIK